VVEPQSVATMDRTFAGTNPDMGRF